MAETTGMDGVTETRTELGLPPVAQLPHNLGSIARAGLALNSVESLESDKENHHDSQLVRAGSLSERLHDMAITGEDIVKDENDLDTKQKPKLKKPFDMTRGSPWPDYQRPSAQECEEVNELLSSVHQEFKAPPVLEPPSKIVAKTAADTAANSVANTVAGCGEVPSILDALVRTYLSGATTAKNSGKAYQGLIDRFGVLKEGVGKNGVNYEAVWVAPTSEIEAALKPGGLANIKSRHLKNLLNQVYSENKERLSELAKKASASPPNGDTEQEVSTEEAAQDKKELKSEEVCADQELLSLQHLRFPETRPVSELMKELTKYGGIGPKTAACVILFSVRRPCFAVDTHCYRICQWLGWIPEVPGLNEEKAFLHLDARIPDSLKYSLHCLFIEHGRFCHRCKAATREGDEEWEKCVCVIESLVRRNITKRDLKKTANDPDAPKAGRKRKKPDHPPTPEPERRSTRQKAMVDKKAGNATTNQNTTEENNHVEEMEGMDPPRYIGSQARNARERRAKETAKEAKKAAREAKRAERSREGRQSACSERGS